MAPSRHKKVVEVKIWGNQVDMQPACAQGLTELDFSEIKLADVANS
jgi:hypothetical protein